MPNSITVTKKGQYLCQIAAEKGFPDCSQFRETNPDLADKAVLDEGDVVTIPEPKPKTTSGETENKHNFVRVNSPPATVRIIGQKQALNDREGATLPRVGISTYITKHAQVTPGKNGGINGDWYGFYDEYGADEEAGMSEDEYDEEKETYGDPAHFRVEVHDVTAGEGVTEIEVELQVMQPVYKRKAAVSVTTIVRDMDFVETGKPVAVRAPKGFKTPKHPDRKLTVECERVGETKYFRSKYLRLVTFHEDKVEEQTVYVGDYYDEEELTDDERRYTEILDQKIRVRYKPLMCTAEKCRAEAIADVGEMRNEVRLTVHVLDKACSEEDVRRVVYGQIRRTYAQAHLRPHLKEIVHHKPFVNVVCFGSLNQGKGYPATGMQMPDDDGSAEPSSFLIDFQDDGCDHDFEKDADNSISKIIAIVEKKITDLRDEDGDGKQKYYTKRIELQSAIPIADDAPENPAQCLMVFEDAACRNPAEVALVHCNDRYFEASNPSLDSTTLGTVSQTKTSVHQMLIRAMCSTNYLDAHIIKDFAHLEDGTLFGVATLLHQGHLLGPASFIVIAGRMKEEPHDKRFVFAHELGHVLMHCGHVINEDNNDQLMRKGDLNKLDAAHMEGGRRIMDDPLKIRYQTRRRDGSPEGSSDDMQSWIGGGDASKPSAVERCHEFLTSVRECMGAPTVREVHNEW